MNVFSQVIKLFVLLETRDFFFVTLFCLEPVIFFSSFDFNFALFLNVVKSGRGTKPFS